METSSLTKRKAVSFLLFQLLCFWPVLKWYALRMSDGSDEPWGIAALLTAVFFIALKPVRSKINTVSLLASLAFSVTYLLGFNYLPMLFKGVLAVSALAFSVTALFSGRSIHGGILGLLILSLPIIASLQFYLGYPIRLLTAAISSVLISSLGYPVDASGTQLLWAGEFIAVDAPCSGIKMLWTGMYLNFTLACLFDLDLRSTWLSYAAAGVFIFLGNVLRASALFFPEAGIIYKAPWMHSSVGLLVFAGVALAIVSFHRRLALGVR